ncbi:aromatic acid decarboxylase [Thermogymnomonas acidicola]|uniref:Flavin prenyltransferase UbiX n=1 Tax=Thermogymnomonas acidicola TaxID=399579 RepID=A0AA37BQL1_9ARCH|nr:UbiX family flavin prenyltransferase [Thermogymnomonas acidicola]GGM70264.1 aromatic acid decarboxylase [Thermogymnomonas acidicola]
MRIVVGVTGGSGSVIALRFLQSLKGHEVHLIVSEHARLVARAELDLDAREFERYAEYVYDDRDVAARVSSGSFIFDALVIVPCSISTLSKIAAGISDTLITRAAAVALKERRKLVLVPRETPLSTLTLRNMLSLSEMGAVILPAMPGYYTRPKSVEDMVDFVVSRILDQIGVVNSLIQRWGGYGPGLHG